MSTLTKVLIVLLSVFSIFLCGIVVTYVAHAENQRKRADDLQTSIGSANAKRQAAEQAKTDAQKAAEDAEAKLKARISELEMSITTLNTQIAKLETDKADALREVTSKTAAADQAVKTMEQLRQTWLADTDKLTKLEADAINRNKEITELNSTLREKMTLIAQRDEEKRQLAESNKELSDRLNQYLLQYGRMATPPKTATATTGSALPATPSQTKNIALSTRVAAVDLQNGLAQVPIGSASGVKTGMTFHVVRGDQFICDIVISKVDPDQAVGTLNYFDRNRAEPRVGDTASTNL